jgi:hypothetical protein
VEKEVFMVIFKIISQKFDDETKDFLAMQKARKGSQDEMEISNFKKKKILHC